MALILVVVVFAIKICIDKGRSETSMSGIHSSTVCINLCWLVVQKQGG